ncbi:putative major intrinsic protein [Helianthus annuus]|nr:putative major intrinsic protein [Helianthus annuus]KAJ0499062.1 putative major intrinsic protein [Helianthus annuus]KAJ0665077.1 putative major intrinsic protein [Helianthus annuus]
MVKLALGSIGDSLSAGSIKSYLAEFIATLLFVFAGVGSAIAYGMLIFLYKIMFKFCC